VLVTSPAASQQADRPAVSEQPDPTRLDAERLPPEAIDVTRDLYSHGFYIEAHLGGRGFIGGIGRLSEAGLYASFGLGYEVFRWLWLGASVEGSIHQTDAPAPPSSTVFELVGFVGELRFQLNVSPRVALWLGGEAGVTVSTSDVLATYGLGDSDDYGLMYGGNLGLDFHMRNRHHSLGITGGSRLYPSLEGPNGEAAVGVHATTYLRYMF
jgi:hypothetical protein